MLRSTASVLLAGVLLSGASAFVPSSISVGRRTEIGSSTLDEPPVVTLKEISGDVPTMPRRKLPVTSQAIPFLERPAVLTGDLAGDVGFDPLGLAKNEETLYAYREAEIKHARLAMLAAAGWPISELLDRKLADYFGVTSILDEGDRVPSLLNGGLEKVLPEWWGFCLGMCAAIDLYGIQRARAAGTVSSYIPGYLGFDPFHLYPTDEEGKKKMQLAEIKHGRVAMLGVTGFAFQEFTSKLGVIDETPFFFFPLTKTISELLSATSN